MIKVDQNQISVQTLGEIFFIKEKVNVSNEDFFNSFSIVKGVNKIIDEEHLLFFPVYLSLEDDGGGWYTGTFDGFSKINHYIENYPNATFVVNESIKKDIKNENVKLIVVDDVMLCIDKLFSYIMNHRIFKSILVTGSVGKTTTVGLIESAISNHVLRIYSKRITPIILKANIINYLTDDIEYVVFEASLFYRHHVKYFSDIMHPYISVILNIFEEHIGIDSIKDKEDITKSKMEILRYSKYALLNMQDEELKKIQFKNHFFVYKNKRIETEAKKVYDISAVHTEIQVPILTQLSFLQYNVAYLVGILLDMDSDILVERLNHALRVENRLLSQEIHRHPIIFDGDVTGVARFQFFTHHFYKKAILVIRALTENGEESEDFSLLRKYFNRFSTVYLFSDIPNVMALKSENSILVDNHDFIYSISKDTTIFYHYGSYFRKYDSFLFENLE